jgi:hypothetical protein
MECAMTSLECGRPWRFECACLEGMGEGDEGSLDWMRFRAGDLGSGVGGGEVDDDDESASIWLIPRASDPRVVRPL